MTLSRRDFLKASATIAAAFGVQGAEALAREGGLSVVWFQAQACTGCSVSLLNSIYYNTIDDLLLNTLDLNYHNNLMASAGDLARSSAEEAYNNGNYVLVVEGAVPTGASGKYCYLWPGMTAVDGVKKYAAKTPFVMAVGTCASFGGVSAALPNPTQAVSLQTLLGTSKKVINIAGCPTHPDWIVGTVAYMIRYGAVPTLDSKGRPTMFFGRRVHDLCPLRETEEADRLGQYGCLEELGCRGPETWGDCPTRRWNTGAANTNGSYFCMASRGPCTGCTEPTFSASRPFFRGEEEGDGESDGQPQPPDPAEPPQPPQPPQPPNRERGRHRDGEHVREHAHRG
jgi:hydrogenase small subunit